MKKEIVTFDAIIDTIIYDSDNYKVYGVTPVSNIENIKLTKYGNTTIIGNIPKLNVGSKYTLNTVEEYNSRYSSNQYKVVSIDTKIPKTEGEIKVFLSEILVPQQVEELLREYPNVVELVMSGKESEIDVKKLFNIGEYRIQVIVDKIKENYLFLDLINFFSDYEVSITLIKNLLTKYGSAEEIKKRFETEPYKILTEVDGIGFKRADEKILKGKPQMIDSRDRLEAALYHILDENENSGNTFAHMSKVLETLKALVPQTIKHIQQVLYDDKPDWIISTKNIVAKKSTYETEKNVADILFEMNSIKNEWDFDKNLIDEGLSEEQKSAIENAMKNNISLIAGVAGCVDADTEFFNGEEWKRIADYKDGDMVLQFNPENRNGELVFPEKYHKYKCEYMTFINTETNSVNQVLSDEHMFVYETSKGNINKKMFSEVLKMHNNSNSGFRGSIINNFNYNGKGIDLSEHEIRLMIAVFADGSFYSYSRPYDESWNTCRFHIKKDRKKDRLKILFEKANVEWWEKPSVTDGYIDLYCKTPFRSKQYPKNWYNASKEQLEIMADEIIHWDGSVDKKGRRTYSTSIKNDADFVQFVYTSCGYVSTISYQNRIGQDYITSGKIYQRKSEEYTVIISKNKNRRTSIANDPRKPNIKTKIEKYKTIDGFKYCFTVNSGMLVLRRSGRIFITGNSGKSFTIGKLIEILDKSQKSYIILAPTGKASKTIAQYTKRDASTIHRGLAFNPSNMPPWRYNKDNKLNVDLVIVDETSMVDVFLMENLLNAIDITNTKLLLIGDPAQIPSVSCGNVYQDMLNSKIFPTTTLTKIFRYGEGGLYKVATNIRSGNEYFQKIEKEITPFGENKDYVFVKCSKEDANKKVLQIYHSLIKKEIPYSDIVVTMAMNKNENGSVMVNKLIQAYLKKNTTYLTDDSIEYGKNKFYVGDIVMQTKNDYKAQTISGMVKPIFNGTLGIIVDIKGQDIHIKFDDDIMLYKKSGLNNILLGYAINTFKCQGSQFPYVIYSHPSSHSYFTNRNLAYTAVSRTQKQCYHISDEKTVKTALRKSAIFDRNTLLKSLILKKYKEVNVVEQ